jgi:carbamoyltransferase
MNILGISALYHDSAACLIRDGEIIAAAQEERFTRKKGDAGIPHHAIAYCLEAGNVGPNEIDIVAFYDKPLSKLTRLMTTYAQVAPQGLKSFLMAVPVWLKEKGWATYTIERYLKRLGYRPPRDFHLAEHHHSHAASAFYPSPFREAAIITVDGVGEWTTTAIGVGDGNHLRMLFEQRFPHSLGMLYSAFTYFTGFKVNSGEYKLMGLAPYGEPKYVDIIKDKLIALHEDGSFRLDLDYFGYLDGLTMTNDRFAKLFGGPRRLPEQQITTREMDLARSIQEVTDEIMLKMARYAGAVTGKRHLCLAGGVALNCVANGHILRSGIFDDIWIQPAAGDAGGAQGAALYSWYHILGNARKADNQHDFVRGSLLGPGFTREQTKSFLDENKIPYRELDMGDRNRLVAEAVADEKVVGMFQGRMEFGPRALGNRSILADARSAKMQSYLNLATKFRESFRPFAPICLEEDAADYFEAVTTSPYMLLVDQVRADRCTESHVDRRQADLKEWVNEPRSDVPAITHVDYSARVQTVDRERSPDLHDVLTEFKRLTGESIMVNTSFNVRSEPIVCTPEDAYVCFMRTGIDVLVLDRFVLQKSEQPEWQEENDWRESFGLD